MGSLKYYRPWNIEDALRILCEHGAQAKILAGGTDLFIKWKKGKVEMEHIVDLKALNMDTVDETPDGGVRIGALCTLNSLLEKDVVIARYPFLMSVIEDMASVQVRNRATIGGNLCNGAPSADLAAPLIALDAQVAVRSSAGSREIALSEFFLGPGVTALKPLEILTAIMIPPLPPKSAAVYFKYKRTAMDIALVGVAVRMSFADSSLCREAKIVLGAVAPTPKLARRAAAILCNSKINQVMVKDAAAMAVEEAAPIDDVRSSKWYRNKIVRVLTECAIWDVCSQISGGEPDVK